MDPPPAPLKGYISSAWDMDDAPINLQRFCDLELRLTNELALREPPQSFPGAPDPAIDGTSTTNIGEPGIDIRTRRATREAEELRQTPQAREARFRQYQKEQKSTRRAATAVGQVDTGGPYPPVGSGYQYDPGAMENGEYNFRTVVGPDSQYKMCYVHWPGWSAKPILNRRKQVVAVLGGKPRSYKKDWDKQVAAATKACDEVAPYVRRSETEISLDASPSVSGGLGLAQEGDDARPARGKSALLDVLAFATLLANPAVLRVAGYATCLFMIFARKMCNIYEARLAEFESYYSASQRLFPCTVFSAATFHLGNRPYMVPENDVAWGWAALTALGNFNADDGGHIILWDLNLVVRFPPGATILIPRALVRYSFTKIAPGETRYCLVQHTPAPVFHFSDNFGSSDLNFAKYGTASQHEQREQQRAHEHSGLWAMDNLSYLEDINEESQLFPGADTPRPQRSEGLGE